MSARHAIRAAMDRVGAGLGLLALCERSMQSALTVLMYHRVLPDTMCADYHLPSLVVPESAFREQMNYLAQSCTVLPVGEAVGQLGTRRRRPLVAITFDDGYVDNYTIAAPIMKEAGVRATFYVTTGLIGTRTRLWFDAASLRYRVSSREVAAAAVEAVLGTDRFPLIGKPSVGEWMAILKRADPAQRGAIVNRLPSIEDASDQDRLMTTDEVRSLASAGHEIGSHTKYHPLLPQLSDADLREEVVESKEAVEGWLGGACRTFCYPNGDHDRRVLEAVRSAGYTSGCTTMAGRNRLGVDPCALRRVDMNPLRVLRNGRHDALTLRSEISQFHRLMRVA